MLGFFKPGEGEHGEDLARAAKLYNAVHHLLTKKCGARAWVKDFAMLRMAHVSAQRIDAALEWFIRHFKDKGSPRLLCAATFRLRFADVEAAMQRDRGGGQGVMNSEISVNQPSWRAAEKLWLHTGAWPEGTTREMLARAHATCLHNLCGWLAWCDTLSRAEPHTDAGRLALHFHEIFFPAASAFAEEWLAKAWERSISRRIGVGSWPSEPFKGYILSPSHPFWQAECRALAADYCGSGVRWDRLLERYENESRQV